ncbi:MAG: Wzz/FepE/Etk N-terminal domain-containing protein [bacterium]
MGVWDIYFVLFKHKWRIIISTIAIILALVLFSFCWPPTFQTSAKFLLEKTTSTLSDPAIFPQHTTSLLRSVTGQEEANNETQIILSRPVLEQVVRQLNLIEPRPDPAPPGIGLAKIQWVLRQAITFVKSLPRITLEFLHIIKPAPPEKRFEKAIGSLRDRLQVHQIADSDVLEIGMKGWFPDQITKEVRAVAAEYLKYHLTVHQSPSAVAFFADHLEDARRQLDDLEQELADYRSDNGLISMDKTETTLLEKIEILERERINLRKEILSLETKLSRIKPIVANPSGMLIPSPEINNFDSVVKLHDELLERRLQLEGLLERYTPENPQVQLMRSEVDRLEASVRREVDRIIGLEEAQLANWRAEDQALGTTLAQLYEAQRPLPQHRLKIEQLDREIREASGLYEAILKKRADSQLTAAQDSRMVKVSLLAQAMPPVDSVWPDLFMNLLIGAPVAPVVAIAVAFLIESLRSTFKREDDIVHALGVPTLAVLEHKITGKRLVEAAREPIRRAASILLEGAGRGARRIVVTSSLPGEGASAVAHFLAEAMGAGAHRRVLIVSGTGASGTGEGAAAVRDSGVPGVSIVAPPGGGAGDNAVMTRDEVKSWLDSVTRDYDVTVVDGPPILESGLGHALAGACDAAVLVVAAESTGQTVADRARQRIREAGAELVGGVLTGYTRYIPNALEQRL